MRISTSTAGLRHRAVLPTGTRVLFAGATNGSLRTNRASRRWRLAPAAIAMLVIASCGELPTAPVVPVEPGRTDHYDLVSSVPLAAAQIEFLVEADAAAVVAVVPLTSDVVLRWAQADGRVHVAWVGEVTVSGAQLRVVFDRQIVVDDLAVSSAAAFTSAVDAGASAAAFSWQPASGTTLPTRSPPAGLPEYDATAPLAVHFADYPLGDVNRDGVLDVRDGMLLLQRLRDGGWSDYERYHGDLDADDVNSADDLILLLDKLVDPYLPARLNVKPSALAFTDLDAASDGPGIILVSNQGTVGFEALQWDVPKGTSIVKRGGLANRSAALEVSVTPADRIGWMPGFATIHDGAGGTAEVRLGNLVVLIAGQSNAVGFGAPVCCWPETPDDGVRMLGNDYVWKDAGEPLDSVDGQLDTVSRDPEARYSFGTRLGNLLRDATGFTTYLIPTGKGGTSVTAWRPAGDLLDRETLFGSAAFRARVSANLSANPVPPSPHAAEGGPVNVLVWYQGESDAPDSKRAGFVAATNDVMNGFSSQLGTAVVYVQLASHDEPGRNRRQHAVSELQRRLETGYGASPRPRFHMVVAHDLPRSDWVHLSAYGQRILADRIDLAIREHVLGEPVDGTGPRLEKVAWSGNTIRLHTTQPLDAGSGTLDAGYFTVFDGEPVGALDHGDYPTDTIDVVSVRRHASDATSVVITLASTPTKVPYVRYMAPPERGPPDRSPSHPAFWQVVASDVIRAAEGSGEYGIGLPLPSFGPLAPFSSP